MSVSPDAQSISGERRHESRFECPPTMVHAHLQGRDEHIPARVKNVSGTGLQLHIDVPIPVATHVTIDLADRIATGEIRHCDLQADWSWTVGVKIHDFQ